MLTPGIKRIYVRRRNRNQSIGLVRHDRKKRYRAAIVIPALSQQDEELAGHRSGSASSSMSSQVIGRRNQGGGVAGDASGLETARRHNKITRMNAGSLRPPNITTRTGWEGIKAAVARDSGKTFPQRSAFMTKAITAPPAPPPLFLRFECEYDNGGSGPAASSYCGTNKTWSRLRVVDDRSPRYSVDAGRSLSSALLAEPYEPFVSPRIGMSRGNASKPQTYLRVVAPMFSSPSPSNFIHPEALDVSEVQYSARSSLSPVFGYASLARSRAIPFVGTKLPSVFRDMGREWRTFHSGWN